MRWGTGRARWRMGWRERGRVDDFEESYGKRYNIDFWFWKIIGSIAAFMLYEFLDLIYSSLR